MSKNIKVKTGKANSGAGFAVGIIFCLIGGFIVIPAFGTFGVLWTLVAVVITIVNGVNLFSEQGIATHEIVIDDDSESSVKDIDTRLNMVERLYQEGKITKEEYDRKRQSILDEI